MLHSMIIALDGDKTIEEVQQALNGAPNTHKGSPTSHSWEDIKDEDLQVVAFEMSKRYGYWEEEA
jgi:hypothetical protein